MTSADQPCPVHQGCEWEPQLPAEIRRWWEPVAEPRAEVFEVNFDGRSWTRLLLKFSGPGLMVAITYMDPANYATDLQAGSRFHYRLLWAVLFAHTCGYAFQVLVVTMTLATGRTLSEEIALEYPHLRYVFWFVAETASVAADFARVMGTASALLMLFDLPLIWGVLVTACDTLLFTGMQALGQRKVETFCVILGALVVFCCVGELGMTGLSLQGLGEVLTGFVPFMSGMSDREEPQTTRDMGAYALVATSVVGASICPPMFFLHSALVQTRRFVGRTPSDPGVRNRQMQAAVKFNSIELGIGIGFALMVNVIVVIVAGQAFYDPQHPHRNPQLVDMPDMLVHVVGPFGRYLFALSLFFGGQSAAVSGTLASQYILDGFLNVRLKLWLRRLATRLASVVPALALTLFFEDRSSEMISISQVVVNFVVPLTLVPILKFTASREKMGEYVLAKEKSYVLWALCFFLTILNIAVVVHSLLESLAGATAWVAMCLWLVPYAGMVAYLTWKPVRVRPNPQTGLAAPSFASFLGIKEPGVSV